MPKPTASASAGAELAVLTAEPETIPGLFQDRVHRHPDRVALRKKDFGYWREITWAEYGEQTRTCGFGLMALGLEPGERVAILSEDRPEWLYADLGIQSAGGITVGMYATASAEQCGYIAGHAEVRIWIVEDQEQFDKAMEMRANLAALRWIVAIDPKGLRRVDDPQVITFDELLERGRTLEQVEPQLLAQRTVAVEPDDTAVLFYTSGTTGPPKGVMHSHRSALDGMRPLGDLLGMSQQDELIAYAPLCHIGERMFSMLAGLRYTPVVNFAETPDTLFRDLVEVAPTFFFGFPRTWEKMKARIDIDMAEATWFKRRIFKLCFGLGERFSACQLEDRAAPRWLRPARWLADLAVLRKLRQRLGLGRVRTAGVGGAAVAPEILTFFRALGVELREGYGQTEAGLTSWTPADGVRLGRAGVPMAEVEFRTSDEGELLIRSPGLLQGYFKNPEQTAQVLQDGWYHTGDIGHIDEEGYLVITGRVKDMIITAAGRNIAPANIENMLKASDYIMDAVVVGEGRHFLTALIVLDEETASHYAQTHGVPFATYADLAAHPDMVALIDAEVQSVNRRWSDREQILDFRILQWELSSEDDELTVTQKVRRSFLCERYADLIEEMYRDDQGRG